MEYPQNVNIRKIKNSDLLELEPSERIKVVGSILEEVGLVDELDVDEVVATAQSVKTGDVLKVVKIMLYIKARYAQGLGRVEAFKLAFPERCVYTEKSVGVRTGVMEKLPEDKKKEITEEDIGKPLSDVTINAKAKTLEGTKLYRMVIATLNQSLYAVYTIDRFNVLDLALRKIYDDRTRDRDRIEYMKVFLQETRKPEEDTGINININNNDIKVVKIEDKLDKIAKNLESVDAGSIIEKLTKKD